MTTKECAGCVFLSGGRLSPPSPSRFVAATFVCLVLYTMLIHVKAEIGGSSALAIAGINFLFHLTRKRSKS